MATFNDDRPIDVHGATLSRRQFVKTGGALVVGLGLVGGRVWEEAAAAAQHSAGAKNSLDATLAS